MSRKTTYRKLRLSLMKVFAALVRSLPRRLALALGELIGVLAFRLASRPRRLALSNLGVALAKELPRRRILDVTRGCFVNFGRSLVETVRLPGMSPEEIAGLVDSDPLDEAARALSDGRGVLFVSGHIGTFELLGTYLSLRLGRPFHVLSRRYDFAPYNELLISNRRPFAIETVFHDESPRRLLDILRSGGALGILADQDLPRYRGVFVDFLGRPAYTPTGPAELARATGADMIPVGITWNGCRHRVHVLPAIERASTGDRRRDSEEMTRRYSRELSALIRRYPDQWAWFHKRWRTKPPSGPRVPSREGQG